MPFVDFDKMDAVKFGDKLRTWRKKKGYTQHDVAMSMQLSGLCCDARRISGIESGEVRISGFELYVLLFALHAKVDDLF